MQRISPAGFTVESSPSAGGASRIALALAPADASDATGVSTTHGEDIDSLRKGLSALRRLSRLEWAERDERDHGLGEAPYPPNYPKMEGEPMRVQPSRARKRPQSD